MNIIQDMIQIKNDGWLDNMRPDRFKCHTICIQDPFELDHNLAQGVDAESEPRPLPFETLRFQCLTTSSNV